MGHTFQNIPFTLPESSVEKTGPFSICPAFSLDPQLCLLSRPGSETAVSLLVSSLPGLSPQALELG